MYNIYELKSLQKKVLHLEINAKYRNKSKLKLEYAQIQKALKTQVSFLTYISVLKLIRSSASCLTKSVKIRHFMKLSNLNSHADVIDLETEKIVVNLSSTTLTDTEVNVLRSGLTYSITPQRLNGLEIQTSFECFFRQFSHHFTGNTLVTLKNKMKHLCNTYIYGYKKTESSNLTTAERLALDELSKKKDIVFCKPDKRNGVVILNKTDYITN